MFEYRFEFRCGGESIEGVDEVDIYWSECGRGSYLDVGGIWGTGVVKGLRAYLYRINYQTIRCIHY
jgi:hypothetical protein